MMKKSWKVVKFLIIEINSVKKTLKRRPQIQTSLQSVLRMKKILILSLKDDIEDLLRLCTPALERFLFKTKGRRKSPK